MTRFLSKGITFSVWFFPRFSSLVPVNKNTENPDKYNIFRLCYLKPRNAEETAYMLGYLPTDNAFLSSTIFANFANPTLLLTMNMILNITQ